MVQDVLRLVHQVGVPAQLDSQLEAVVVCKSELGRTSTGVPPCKLKVFISIADEVSEQSESAE